MAPSKAKTSRSKVGQVHGKNTPIAGYILQEERQQIKPPREQMFGSIQELMNKRRKRK